MTPRQAERIRQVVSFLSGALIDEDLGFKLIAATFEPTEGLPKCRQRWMISPYSYECSLPSGHSFRCVAANGVEMPNFGSGEEPAPAKPEPDVCSKSCGEWRAEQRATIARLTRELREANDYAVDFKRTVERLTRERNEAWSERNGYQRDAERLKGELAETRKPFTVTWGPAGWSWTR